MLASNSLQSSCFSLPSAGIAGKIYFSISRIQITNSGCFCGLWFPGSSVFWILLVVFRSALRVDSLEGILGPMLWETLNFFGLLRESCCHSSTSISWAESRCISSFLGIFPSSSLSQVFVVASGTLSLLFWSSGLFLVFWLTCACQAIQAQRWETA